MLHLPKCRREFVQPIETCFYWRSTSPSQVTGISDHGTLSRLYIRIQEVRKINIQIMKGVLTVNMCFWSLCLTIPLLIFLHSQLDLSLTELLLDKLLYVVGKLDLAGPFDVRKSAVLVNCCKVSSCPPRSLEKETEDTDSYGYVH